MIKPGMIYRTGKPKVAKPKALSENAAMCRTMARNEKLFLASPQGKAFMASLKSGK